MHRWAISLFVAGGLTVCSAHAQPQATGPEVRAGVERVVVSRQAGATSLALSNGVDVHIRPMSKPGAGRVVIAVFVPGLELDETEATRGGTMLAIASLTLVPGDERVRASQRPEGLLITANCPANATKAMLGRLAQTLQEPVFDGDAFGQVLSRTTRQRKGGGDDGDPERSDTEAMLRLLTPADDPRLRHPTRAHLEAVVFAEASARLRTQLRTRAIDVSIVGDVDASTLTPAVTETLGTLPTRPRDRLMKLRTIERRPPPAPPGDHADAVVTGPRPLLAVSFPAPPFTDLADARLAGVAARLMERQVAEALKESGLTVTLASGVAMSGRTYPGLGSVIGSFVISGDDVHVRSAAATARARIAKLIDTGPTAAQLQRAIDDAAAEIEPRIDTADYWSQGLAMAWFLGVPIDELDTAPAAIRATTAKQLRQHMAKWWKSEQTLTVTILAAPEAPAPPREP